MCKTRFYCAFRSLFASVSFDFISKFHFVFIPIVNNLMWILLSFRRKMISSNSISTFNLLLIIIEPFLRHQFHPNFCNHFNCLKKLVVCFIQRIVFVFRLFIHSRIFHSFIYSTIFWFSPARPSGSESSINFLTKFKKPTLFPPFDKWNNPLPLTFFSSKIFFLTQFKIIFLAFIVLISPDFCHWFLFMHCFGVHCHWNFCLFSYLYFHFHLRVVFVFAQSSGGEKKHILYVENRFVYVDFNWNNCDFLKCNNLNCWISYEVIKIN